MPFATSVHPASNALHSERFFAHFAFPANARRLENE